MPVSSLPQRWFQKQPPPALGWSRTRGLVWARPRTLKIWTACGAFSPVWGSEGGRHEEERGGDLKELVPRGRAGPGTSTLCGGRVCAAINEFGPGPGLQVCLGGAGKPEPDPAAGGVGCGTTAPLPAYAGSVWAGLPPRRFPAESGSRGSWLPCRLVCRFSARASLL